MDYRGFIIWHDKLHKCWRAKIDRYSEAIFPNREETEKYIDELIARKNENDD